jgi:hypothetical protein
MGYIEFSRVIWDSPAYDLRHVRRGVAILIMD